MRVIENIAYSTVDTSQVLDVYLPDFDVRGVFVYFHGGGLIGGNKSVAKKFSSYVTERNIALVSANYRLYPNANFPDFIDEDGQSSFGKMICDFVREITQRERSTS